MSPYFSRLQREDHLAGKRGEIYETICQRPGINFEALRDEVGMTGGGGAQHHLYVLEKLEYVQSFKVGRYRRYFAAGDDHFRRNRICALLTAPIYRETAELVLRNPGASQGKIAEKFSDVSRQAVGYRLKALESAGAISRQRDSHGVYYYATMDGGYVLDHARLEPLNSGVFEIGPILVGRRECG